MDKGAQMLGDDDSVLNFRCAFCGRFVSRTALDSFGIPRHWLIVSTRDPHSRTSDCYKPHELEKECPDEHQLYVGGLLRLIAYAIQEGVIDEECLRTLADGAKKQGRNGMVDWVDELIREAQDDDE